MIRLIYFALIFALPLLAYPCFAANYYIDFDSGNDSNNGTSTSTPWKHCPGDDNATGTADSTTLQAGDSVIFKGGVSYKGTVSILASGTSGSPITYDGNSAGSFGSGRAIFDQENDQDTAFTMWGYSWIVIDNFEFTEIGGYSTWPTGSCPLAARSGTAINIGTSDAGNSSAGGSNITIQNCYFHEIGEWHNTEPATISTISGNGIRAYNATDITVDNCEFTRMKIAIGFAANQNGTADGLEVKNCSIHDYVVWGVDVTIRGTGATIQNIAIHDNEIGDFYQYDEGDWSGCSGYDNPHTDHIFIRGGSWSYSNATWGTNKIYNNKFYNSNGVSGANGTAAIYVSAAGGTLYIYNNEFINLQFASGIIYLNNGPPSGGTATDYHVYNNSFNGTARQVVVRSETVQINDVTIKGNAFYKVDDSSPYNPYAVMIYRNESGRDSFDNVTMDYNTYDNSQRSSSDQVIWMYNTDVVYWSENPCSTYSIECNGQFAEVGYTDYTYSSPDLSPISNSNLIDDFPTAQAPTSIFTTDKDGNSRPVGSAWDIGAYEYGSGDTTRTIQGITIQGVTIQ